jgi:hypothetical protein
MEKKVFKQNESFRFNISISDRCYDYKPTSEDYKLISFHVENLSADELIDRIKLGHSICHVFKDNRRKKSHFMYASAVFIDVDDCLQPMETFLDECVLKPSVAYTTFSDGKNGQHRFRLIYLFNEQISSAEEYKNLYYKIVSMIKLENTKDNCGSITTQLMNGNSNSNVSIYCSYLVYNKGFFLQNCHLELYTSQPTSQYSSNRQFCKNIAEGNTFSEEELLVIQDLNNGVVEFLEKYSYVDKIDETKLDYNTDGYAFFPLAYYKLNIRIDWSKKKPKILKYRDGEGRRKRLYIDTIMIRAIKPDVSFLELLYNLVFRRQYFYDNSDKVLTNKILIDDVRTILKMKMDDIYALNSSKHGAFKTDAVYCAEHGISRRQHSRTVRKMLNYQCIGEWYDVSKSVNQNYKYAQTQKIKVSLNTLKNFCVENDIDMYPNKKPISEWYDVQLSVK